MSLYRAGLRLALFPPLGIAMAACAALGFTDVSPVFTLPLRAEATLVDRTRVREPSTLGSTCLASPIVFNCLRPDGQGRQTASPDLSFNGSAPNEPRRDPVWF